MFAPLILSPIASQAAGKFVTVDKKSKGRIGTLKIMRFEQVSFDLYNQMNLHDADLRYEVFNKALMGYYSLKHEGKLSDKGILTIVDFTKSSNEKRLWVVDLDNKTVLYNTYVAHGRNSGEVMAENFSNEHKSNMSSIGFYVTEGIYYGKHGKSLKLNGVDENFNTNALDRCIVMHGAEYATEDFIEEYGRLGRSLGCPALPMGEHEGIIDTVKENTALYIHASNDAYTSQYLDHANAMAGLIEEGQPNPLPPPVASI
ncbi:murein L,D-transpeptidase catalytic domain family protein [Pontibacter roseus]|uniref:murein L,D-transpeptidase catalytic domain family protein n=1 Tax=Pontibacter roseus TaxID=336989 RepID=UPI00035E8F03|nr:murein L,D-transpeptidase catalytic domain family protein [Pontibacter roseus]